MASYYTPQEGIAARKRAAGKKLTTAGATLVGLGILGIILATALKITWILGFIGGPIGGLAWLAVLVGVGLFVYGFLQLKEARESRTL
ncbi:MAG TPA: hypothetical protein VG942_17690 [Hyphomonadaceae bacterium]|nr:hypothetical protein [Hyphomonadaceae bacterium]